MIRILLTIAYVIVCPAAGIALLVPPTYEAVLVLATSQGAVGGRTLAASAAVLAASSVVGWLGVTLSVWLRWGSILSGVGVAAAVVWFLFLAAGPAIDAESHRVPAALILSGVQAALGQGARMLVLLAPTPRRSSTPKGIVASAAAAGASWILLAALQLIGIAIR